MRAGLLQLFLTKCRSALLCRHEIGNTSPQPSPNLGEGAQSLEKDRVINSCVSTVNSLPSCPLAFCKCHAFTLAEVLITLAIIGVVAAMTMPTLIQNHQKKSLEVATKKFYSMMSQAVKQYMADEGVDDLRNTALASENYEDTASPEAIGSIRNFVTKYLKVAKECDHDANDCFAKKYKAWDGGETDSDFTESTDSYDYLRDYVLADGAIIRIGYTYANDQPIVVYVDINGKKGPNRVGYDLWSMSIFYDGIIDESFVGPELRGGAAWHTPHNEREAQFERCKEYQLYGGCFGHFLENGFKFDY